MSSRLLDIARKFNVFYLNGKFGFKVLFWFLWQKKFFRRNCLWFVIIRKTWMISRAEVLLATPFKSSKVDIVSTFTSFFHENADKSIFMRNGDFWLDLWFVCLYRFWKKCMSSVYCLWTASRFNKTGCNGWALEVSRGFLHSWRSKGRQSIWGSSS